MPACLAARNEVFRRLFREEAAIAGMRIAQMRLEGRDLCLETQECRRDQRLLQLVAEIVEQIARGEIVAAIRDEIETAR